MNEHDSYVNPLNSRYASAEMSHLFSDNHRYYLWRKLWLVLAQSEQKLGLNITNEQLKEMSEHLEDIDYDVVASLERKLKHDVMAHIHAFGVVAPHAFPIIHLGATSCYVTDNAEIMMMKEALELIKTKVLNVINNLTSLASKYSNLPTLGLTHLQPAQLTTVGKRFTLYIQDLMLDLNDLDLVINQMKLRGATGATGTQASFLDLFDQDVEKVNKLQDLIVKSLGYSGAYDVTGQTYPRKIDYNVTVVLSKIAQSASKFANDLRLLQSKKEMEEPIGDDQVGSSAMAYKRNPMLCERICSLSRYVESLPINCAFTASTQWFERTLDDSANKRIVIPQAFLALDGILDVYYYVTSKITIYPKIIAKHINEELPFMATENIIMEMVKCGYSRQDVHEKIRTLSRIAAVNVKELGMDNNLISLIRNDPFFTPILSQMDSILNPTKYVGMAPLQTMKYIDNVVNPILNQYKNVLNLQVKIEL